MSKKSTSSTQEGHSVIHFLVVGVGASAGGLEAFKKLIKAIPENTGMAYIFMQHFSPDHESLLSEILQRDTSIPVHAISNNVTISPDHIYIIPSNKILTATDGILKLSPLKATDRKNMPIDIFLKSLAEVHRDHAIGIVLSGTGTDGTMGLKYIKDHGGITLAQKPGDAAYDEMPQSAIRAAVVDFVLAVEKMPQQLLQLTKALNKPNQGAPSTTEKLTEEECFQQILSLLRLRNGVDFTYYKQSTIRRRIIRRMALLNLEQLIEYRQYLKQNKGEQDHLFQDLLISVSGFFRDPGIFEKLCKAIFPQLVKNNIASRVGEAHGTKFNLRIWVAGCSTGEEAYSIGICLYEFLENKDFNTRIQIFATDLSEQSIAKARAGLYTRKQLEGVSEKRLTQFFTKIDGEYHVKKMIRDMCVFATHNILKDPPFAKMDFISCRNVLIYMEPFLQKKALSTFHYALNNNGFLLLGKSETTGSSGLFQTIGNTEKLYTKKPVTGRYMPIASQRQEKIIRDKDYSVRGSGQKEDGFQKKADDIVLSKYAPAGVIVNELLDIVQFRGYTGEFLTLLPGRASLNVLKMAREGLSFELRNALYKSKTTGESYSKEGIPVNTGKKNVFVSIEVIPLLNTPELHFLILFKKSQLSLIGDQEYAIHKEQSATSSKKDRQDKHIMQLEKELLQAREDMRNITQNQEAANEEMQSANEELLSGTEELQSLNEELETSKEELQSMNEELITVNQELFDRNISYNHAKIYAEAVFATVHEPLLVISKEFIVKSANESFYKTFRLTEAETLGNVLFELQNNGWDIPLLRNYLMKIQSGGYHFLDWELSYTFPLAGKRTIRFNAQPVQEENGEKWTLLAMEDITERTRLQFENKELLNRFKKLVEQAPIAMMVLNGNDYIVELANAFYLEMVGKKKSFIGKRIFESLPELQSQGIKEVLDAVMQTGKPSYNNEVEIHLKRNKKWVQAFYNFVYHPVAERDNSIKSIIVLGVEVTDQVISRKKIEESEARFHQMADLMPAKVFTANAAGDVTYFNKSWLDYAGKSFGELKDFGYQKIMHPDEVEAFKKRMQQAAETSTVLEMEMRFMNKEGKYRWHLNRALPLTDANGQITMWIGATTDIHDQKNKEQAKDDFINAASHELKTPLTAAKAFMQLLEQIISLKKGSSALKNENAEELLYVKKANKAIDKLGRLIGELLDVSKIRLGTLTLNITTFNFDEMLAVAIENVELTSPNHQIIKISTVQGPVKADKEKMEQVIINLLSNAVKYSPGAPEILLSAVLEDGQLKVCVKDRGVGINSANLNKVFDRYFREEDQAIHFPGLGIGLAISSEIIQQHNGKIWVESKPGKGSNFYFTIPV